MLGNNWPVLRRLTILGMLLACLYMFGYSEQTEVSHAAPCIQECETNLNYCNDTCDEDCREDSDDATCESCLQSCSQDYFQCLSYAVSCQGLDVNPGRCEVGFSAHCPIFNGVPNCAHPDAHMGYHLTCELFSQSGVYCVSCPDYHYCTGSGLPPCFGL